MSTDKPSREFALLLAQVYGMYGKPLPDASVIGSWSKALAPFKQDVIEQAFSAYSMERPDFAPVPMSIAARCRLLDGRPDENEAWALSLAAKDEQATVVWTEEMSAAWHQSRSLAHDEVACRMAFKDAYKRLVAEARARGTPAKWNISEGPDKLAKLAAVKDAVRLGRIAPEAVAGLQIAYTAPSQSDEYPEGLRKVKELVAGLEDPREKANRIRDERVQAEYEAEQQEKRAIDARVKQYQNDKNSKGQG